MKINPSFKSSPTVPSFISWTAWLSQPPRVPVSGKSIMSECLLVKIECKQAFCERRYPPLSLQLGSMSLEDVAMTLLGWLCRCSLWLGYLDGVVFGSNYVIRVKHCGILVKNHDYHTIDPWFYPRLVLTSLALSTKVYTIWVLGTWICLGLIYSGPVGRTTIVLI